jgi:hypothetical protein
MPSLGLKNWWWLDPKNWELANFEFTRKDIKGTKLLKNFLKLVVKLVLVVSKSVFLTLCEED